MSAEDNMSAEAALVGEQKETKTETDDRPAEDYTGVGENRSGKDSLSYQKVKQGLHESCRPCFCAVLPVQR